MRIPARYNERPALRFNITPLIDVVFLLIIFFLVASHFVRSEQAEPVELPLASTGESDNELAPHRLTVTIDDRGRFFISGELQSKEVVRSRIAELQAVAEQAGVDPQVRLRGHKDGRYGPMRELIEHCAASNIRSIQLAVAVSGGS